MKKQFEQVYILDTNILLDNVENIFNISQNGSNLLVLPETVLDECDSKKTGFETINFQARELGRILADSEIIEKDVNSDRSIIRVKIKDDVIIDIISLSKYNLDSNADKSIINDRKIIEVAKFSKNYYDLDCTLLSLDIMCRTRAISLDVDAESLDFNKKDKEYNFIKEFNIDSTILHTIENKPIISIDPDYSPENYCYMFKAETGHEKPAVIINGNITFIEEEKLRKAKSKIIPKNLGQLFAMTGMVEPSINVCLIDALAGSGKTLLALAAGMRCIDLGMYDKIVYIRNSIESVDRGEEIGFLSGNDEKFRIYNMPLYDTLEFIVSQANKKDKNAENTQEQIDALINKYQIQPVWVGEMRGRTFVNAFVIVDEIQNMSRKTGQLVLSRLDDNCKVVCIGSNRQIDNLYVNKFTNAMSLLLEESCNPGDEVNMFATKLDKVVRGRITKWAERVFTKDGK